MAKEWVITRDTAEFLVDLLEESPNKCSIKDRLNDELRELFGMIKREDHPTLTRMSLPERED